MTWFDNLKMAYKLAIAFGVCALITSAVGFVGKQGLADQNQTVESLVAKNLKPLVLINDAESTLIAHDRDLYWFVYAKQDSGWSKPGSWKTMAMDGWHKKTTSSPRQADGKRSSVFSSSSKARSPPAMTGGPIRSPRRIAFYKLFVIEISPLHVLFAQPPFDRFHHRRGAAHIHVESTGTEGTTIEVLGNPTTFTQPRG